MANQFKEKFSKLISDKKANNYKFFNDYSVKVLDKDWQYIQFNIDSDIFDCALEVAKEKHKYTMNCNQNLSYRTAQEKLIKQTQGILAEMAIHIFLQEIVGLNVLRYDLERQSFEYSSDEYDIKINNCEKIEVRSSNGYSASIPKFIEKESIIGPYVNKFKTNEKLSDFYFRPIYFPAFSLDGEKPWNSFKLFILGGATKLDMQTKSFIGHLGQNNTDYKLVKFTDGGDIDYIKKKLRG